MTTPDDSGDRSAWAPPPYDRREQRSTVWITVVLFAGFMALMLVVAALVVGGLREAKSAGAVQTPPSAAKPVPSSTTPQQASEPARKYETANNPLVAPGITLDGVTCALPKLGNTQEKLELFYNALVPCLGQAWNPALGKAKEPTTSVLLTAAETKDTSCGSMPPAAEASAMYCPSSTTIHAPWKRQVDGGVDLTWQLFLFAHEYAHHVQYESGIMTRHDRDVVDLGDDRPKALELGRRLELQADCFSGLFLAQAAGRGSISKASIAPIGGPGFNPENSETHGSTKNAALWQKRGLKGKDTSACNTFAAPAAEVS
ncbi:neutral zinc metallopeptidase [Amycolatopsis sp. NPDC051071]|uniref:neutral zinc metallopeptidase n=1 Tax=Amycolatopsis sp. NPDC051071 TaxID=3154637 RepID=UPI00342CF36E